MPDIKKERSREELIAEMTEKFPDRIAAFRANPTSTIAVSIDDLAERSANGIICYCAAITGEDINLMKMPKFDIDGKQITITIP